jgi:endo-1,4-beta-D-glucanase Y
MRWGSAAAVCAVLAACSGGDEASAPPRGSGGSSSGGTGQGGASGSAGSGAANSGGSSGNGAGGNGGDSGGASGNGGAGGSGTGGTLGSGTGGSGGGTHHGIAPSNANQQHARDAYASFKTNYFADCGANKRVATGKDSAETFSEGMGYGMLMVAYLEPDATGPNLMKQLLAFVNSKLDPDGLMHWKVSCTEVWGQNAATDGDLDYTLALIQAERRWPGNGFGDAARGFLTKMLAKETDGCGLKPGDAWGGCGAEANPSYAAISYLETFRCFTGDAAWSSVRANTMTRQLGYWLANYALPPDWVNVDTTGQSGRHSRGEYTYDAARVPWRIGLDFVWRGSPDSREQAHKIVNQLRATDPNPSSMGDGYSFQSGSKISNNHNSVFVGPAAVGAMVDATHQSWLDAAYSELLTLEDGRYFNDGLRVLSLMTLTGLFTNPGQ